MAEEKAKNRANDVVVVGDSIQDFSHVGALINEYDFLAGYSNSQLKYQNLTLPLKIREIAKEVYLKAGHEFEFVEGDKSKQHESVQAYKKAVEDAKEKASQIIHESLKVAESVENEAKKSK